MQEQIDRWVKDLNHARFTIREQAANELEKRIDLVAPALRKVLADRPSLEMRRRLTQLLDLADSVRWRGEALRSLRAVEVLERIGSAEARSVLATIADGAPGGRLTREAKASLQRLSRQAPAGR